jgi:hypothetical protein
MKTPEVIFVKPPRFLPKPNFPLVKNIFEVPGPGAYNLDESLGRKAVSFNNAPRTSGLSPRNN